MNTLLKLARITQSLSVLVAFGTVASSWAEPLVVESRTADGAVNSPAYTELSGAWGNSKNKSKAESIPALVGTNVSACSTSSPAPAFAIAPSGLKKGTAYKVEVTFGTSRAQPASSNLVIAVTTTGVSKSTIPGTTTAFQNANANSWTELGTITPSSDKPVITFKYASGTLSKSPAARWYSEAVRFVEEGSDATAGAKAEPKKESKGKPKAKADKETTE